MNLNKIIQEWFYRLDKGYATPPYNETELKILDEVLIEFNVSSNYRSTIQNLSSIEERSDEEIDDAPPTTDDSADHYVQNSDFRDLLDSFEKFKEILYRRYFDQGLQIVGLDKLYSDILNQPDSIRDNIRDNAVT